MNRYNNLKTVAYALQAIGLATLTIFLLLLASSPDIRFVFIGLVSFIVWYAAGGALLILIDIAVSVRASAVIAMEQEDRRKAKVKPSSNGKPATLRRIDPEKRKQA